MTKNISKRDALKALALMATGFFQFNPSTNLLLAESSRKDKLKGKKVAIIGAGVSGLILPYSKTNVCRSNYLGGNRLHWWTSKDRLGLGAPFEYGAGWIHGPSPDNPIKQLADQAKSSYFVTNDDSCELLDVLGNDIASEIWDEIEEIWQDVLNEIYNDPKISFLDLINEYDEDIWEDPNVRWIFSAYTEFDFCGPLDKISASLTKEMSAFPTDDVVLTSGDDKVTI